jgi:TonB dependent receptor-like, beta-barrel/Carboxypeptidase regulatory-like domain/TonB-dependent Receptor Plug Domain
MGRSCCALVMVVAIAGSAAAQEKPSQRLAGRPLAEALQILRSQGLRLVFSAELVRRDMRVKEEPKAGTAREALDEILRPHQLIARDGPGGVISIVAMPRRSEARPPPVLHGDIQGRVVDANSGVVMPNVLVRLGDMTVSTDDNGSFAFSDVPAGRQSLYVSTIGYALAKPVVDVKADRITAVTVALAAGAGTYTEKVTVRGERPRSTSELAPSQRSIDSADLQDLRGVLADDPMRAVQAMPGTVATDDYTSKFSIRGSDFAHVGVSIDGVATSWLLHEVKGAEDTGSIALVNGDVLDRVSVASGLYSQRFGDRTGGWVEFELREGSRAARQLRGAVSMTSASLIAEGPIGKSGRGSWIASARQSYLDLVIRWLGGPTRPAFGFSDGHVKAIYDFGSRHQFQFTMLGGRSTLAQERRQLSPNAVREGDSKTGLATVAVRSTWSRIAITNRAIAVGEKFLNSGQAGDLLGRGASRDLGLRSDATVDAAPSMLLNIGSEYRQQRGSWEEQNYDAPSGVPIPVGPLTTGNATTKRGSVYAEALWHRGRMRVAPGIRWTESTIAAGSAASPWLLASWQLSDQWRARVGAGVQHQFPDPIQLARYGVDGARRPERASHVDLALEQSLASWRWQVSIFGREDADLLRLEDAEMRVIDGQPVVPTVAPHFENALRASTRGLEVVVQPMRVQRLSGWISYAIGHTKVTDVLTGETFDGDFDQRHTFNAYGRYRISPRTTVSAKLRVGSNVPIAGYFEQRDDGLFLSEHRNRARLPAYARLDARFNHVFNFTKRRLTLFVEVLNVLNRTNVGPDDGSVAFRSGRALGYTRSLLPVLPSAGLIVEF